MKIRLCPACAQLVHFEANRAIQECWNCRRATDFSTVKAPEERLGLWLLSGAENALSRVFFLWPNRLRAGKIALVAAMPVAIVMLLLCNSFDVQILHDLVSPFSIP